MGLGPFFGGWALGPAGMGPLFGPGPFIWPFIWALGPGGIYMGVPLVPIGPYFYLILSGLPVSEAWCITLISVRQWPEDMPWRQKLQKALPAAQLLTTCHPAFHYTVARGRPTKG